MVAEESSPGDNDGKDPNAPPPNGPSSSEWSSLEDLALLDLDPDDPNYQHQETLRALYKAYTELPPGWSRNVNGDGNPPFVHEDGSTSWKNPARERIQQILDEAEREKSEVWSAPNKSSEERRLLKKYRMMIKNGVPLHAVENQARIDAVVDPAMLVDLGSTEEGQAATSLRAERKTSSNDASDKKKARKYKAMLKSGVPRPAVETQAKMEGMDLATLLGDEDEELPTNQATPQQWPLFRQCNDKPESKAGQSKKELEFLPDSNGKTTDLSTLVRRMVQTVRKRTGRSPAQHGTSSSCSLVVDVDDLYNALGSFRGVQHARDVYNSTCHRGSLSECEIRSRRKPFLEHLSALGIRPPATMEGTVDIEGLDDFIAFIEKEHGEVMRSMHDQFDVGMYDFDSLSELYKPGDTVVAKDVFASGVDMMVEVLWSRYEQGKTLFGVSKYFKVCFQFVVAVGKHFTVCEFVEGMEHFEGRRGVKTLQFIPLRMYDAETVQRMRRTFRDRGRMYSSCASSATFLRYGKGSFHAKGGRQQQESQTTALRMEGRVMVDTVGSYEAGHSLSVGYDPMIYGIKLKYKEYNLHMRQMRKTSADGTQSATGVGDDGSLVLFDEVPADYMELCWPAAVGFSFTSKAWGEVLVDGLSDIKFDGSVFDRLVLPSARKHMIKALVRHSSDAFSDIVSGKGEGSVFLLYGPPGVGKTLTAEAISEMLHRPLYSVSLGQLGTTPAELERKLGEILDLCGRWDALILLDEADIFLEKRTSNGSLERNAMVSVMLRLVEYFKGVLFLTSNRVDSLDPAFKTRITLALRYDHLDVSARNQVWINLLAASGLVGNAKEEGKMQIDTQKLAEYELNGREIKNAIRLAIALAKEDGTVVSQEMILETVAILCDFNEKMNSAESY